MYLRTASPCVPSLAMLEEWSARTGLWARKEMLHLGVPGSGYPEDRSGELACAQVVVPSTRMPPVGPPGGPCWTSL